MQSLHDDDNRTLGLVIQPRQQSVGVPLLQGIPGALRLCLLRLQRSSIITRLPPRPVRVPPTEVARREPLAVVMTSVSVSFAGLILVREIHLGKDGAHQGATIVGVLACKPFGIADANNPASRSWPRIKAGRHTEAQIDLRLRGGTVMINRLVSPLMTRLSSWQIASMCQFGRNDHRPRRWGTMPARTNRGRCQGSRPRA